MDPGSTALFVNPVRLRTEASGIRRRRMRPIPSPSTCAAITTKALFPKRLRPPPAWTPPTYVSSTSICAAITTKALFPKRLNHGASELLEAGPGCPIAPEPEQPLQPKGADPVLLVGEPPHGAEPGLHGK